MFDRTFDRTLGVYKLTTKYFNQKSSRRKNCADKWSMEVKNMENGQAIGHGRTQQRDGQNQLSNWGQTRIAFGLPPTRPRDVDWELAFVGLSYYIEI